ncbi:MAG: hypothetical protein RL662_1315 [Bacteroidota bacterium]
MKRHLLIGLVCISSLFSQLACQTQPQTQSTPLPMQALDSLLSSYISQPVYYAEYGNRGCRFELYINGVLVDQLRGKGTIGKTATTINPEILKSGKQKVKLRLFPYPKETRISNENPFQLEIGYNDFSVEVGPQEQRPWHVSLTMPPISVPSEGLPYYEYEGTFDANVPYRIHNWSNCIDLRQIPDIEERVVAEFNKVRQWMVDREFDSIKAYYAYRDNELAVCLYESTKTQARDWKRTCNDISDEDFGDFLPIEEYEMLFSADGKVVTLHSKKKRGFNSALLKIKEIEGTSQYRYDAFHLNLGIREGTNELIAIVG